MESNLLKQDYYGHYIDMDSAKKLVDPQTITACLWLTKDVMDLVHSIYAG